MRARDVMTTKVITVDPHMLVAKIAALLIARHISAVPVVEPDGTLVGIVSEGGGCSIVQNRIRSESRTPGCSIFSPTTSRKPANTGRRTGLRPETS